MQQTFEFYFTDAKPQPPMWVLPGVTNRRFTSILGDKVCLCHKVLSAYFPAVTPTTAKVVVTISDTDSPGLVCAGWHDPFIRIAGAVVYVPLLFREHVKQLFPDSQEFWYSVTAE